MRQGIAVSFITDNVALARECIRSAALEAGRDPGEIRLLAATKLNPPRAIREAIEAGVDICAENRVQEFVEKNQANAYAGCGVHFIGHLQKNKVRFLVGAVELIHSVDSPGPQGLPELLELAGSLPGLRVTGLMTIPPVSSAPGENCRYFRQMRELFVDIRGKKYDNVLMTELSMGMSADYEDAVRCGATIVRLGTAIFGPRTTTKQEAPGNGITG